MLSFLKKLFLKDTRYQTIDGAAFDQALANTPKHVILDVRQKHEFDRGKLRNALNMDIMNPNFRTKVANLDPEKTYFVYCQSGGRSARACGILADMGFKKAINLKGGMSAYTGKTV